MLIEEHRKGVPGVGPAGEDIDVVILEHALDRRGAQRHCESAMLR